MKTCWSMLGSGNICDCLKNKQLKQFCVAASTFRPAWARWLGNCLAAAIKPDFAIQTTAATTATATAIANTTTATATATTGTRLPTTSACVESELGHCASLLLPVRRPRAYIAERARSA